MLARKREQHRDRRRKSTHRSKAPTPRRAAAKLWRKKAPTPRRAAAKLSRKKAESAAATSPSRRWGREVRPGVLGLALGLGSYAAMVALMWLTFARSGEGAFVMLIATLIFATFLVVPLIVLRLARRESTAAPAPLRDYLGRTMETLTGPLGSRAALVQIIVVPALLTLCLVGIDVALALAR
jgi:type IV secretory pathway VirB2 component (pilin)